MVRIEKQKGGIPMVKKRLFKIGTIQRNMLSRGLMELPQAAIQQEISQLAQKILTLPGKKLYLDENEFHWAVLALNGLRDKYLGAGRSSGGIDKVLLRLMKSKYKKVRE
jgi:hypothetical protein